MEAGSPPGVVQGVSAPKERAAWMAGRVGRRERRKINSCRPPCPSALPQSSRREWRAGTREAPPPLPLARERRTPAARWEGGQGKGKEMLGVPGPLRCPHPSRERGRMEDNPPLRLGWWAAERWGAWPAGSEGRRQVPPLPARHPGLPMRSPLPGRGSRVPQQETREEHCRGGGGAVGGSRRTAGRRLEGRRTVASLPPPRRQDTSPQPLPRRDAGRRQRGRVPREPPPLPPERGRRPRGGSLARRGEGGKPGPQLGGLGPGCRARPQKGRGRERWVRDGRPLPLLWPGRGCRVRGLLRAAGAEPPLETRRVPSPHQPLPPCSAAPLQHPPPRDKNSWRPGAQVECPWRVGRRWGGPRGLVVWVPKEARGEEQGRDAPPLSPLRAHPPARCSPVGAGAGLGAGLPRWPVGGGAGRTPLLARRGSDPAGPAQALVSQERGPRGAPGAQASPRGGRGEETHPPAWPRGGTAGDTLPRVAAPAPPAWTGALPAGRGPPPMTSRHPGAPGRGLPGREGGRAGATPCPWTGGAARGGGKEREEKRKGRKKTKCSLGPLPLRSLSRPCTPPERGEDHRGPRVD